MSAELRTVVDDSKHIFNWEFSIKNVSRLPVEQCFFSPKYTVNNLSWKVSFRKTAENKLAIYAHSDHCSKNPVSWSCSALVRFTLISFRPGSLGDFSGEMQQVLFSSTATSWGFESFIAWNSVINPVREFIQNDVIKFRIHIEASDLNVGKRDPNSETVSETIKKSFGNQEDSDFKFIVEGKEIYVHKTILKLRSQYFKCMFQEHWQEGNESSAEINENYETMVAFLKYLYTDKLNVDPRVALGVSVIADKYCKSNVINVCLRTFAKGLNNDNVAELYELTCEQKIKNFSELCIEFASHNLKGIVSSEGFRNWKVDTYKSFFEHDKIRQACDK